MKMLITLAGIGLAFYASSGSLAQDRINVFGVELPIERREVKDQLTGDYLSSKARGTYSVFGVQLPLDKQKTAEAKIQYRADKESNDDNDYIFVFGVKVPVKES